MKMARSEINLTLADNVRRNVSCLIESGPQLFAKLAQPISLISLHSKLLPYSPTPSEIIEICYDKDTPLSLLLSEFICNSILPVECGGKKSGVIIIQSNGKFNINSLIKNMKQILNNFVNLDCDQCIEECLTRLHLISVYDSLQLYIAIQSMENLLSHYENISLVLLDTIKAFYWSERMFGSKVINMETHITNILSQIKNVTKDFKSVIMYTKFKNINKYDDGNEWLKKKSFEVDYKLNMTNFEDCFQISVDVLKDKSCNKYKFTVENEQIVWS